MNTPETKNTRTGALMLAGIFFIGVVTGFGLAPEPNDLQEQLSTSKAETQEARKTIGDREDTIEKFRELKEVDDQGFQYSAEALGYCSEGFTAIGELDAEGVTNSTRKINELTPKVLKLSEERNEITKELGY